MVPGVLRAGRQNLDQPLDIHGLDHVLVEASALEVARLRPGKKPVRATKRDLAEDDDAAAAPIRRGPANAAAPQASGFMPISSPILIVHGTESWRLPMAKISIGSPARAVFAACVAVSLLVACNERDAAQGADADEMPPLIEREVDDPNVAPSTSDTSPGALVIAPMPPPPTEADTTDVPIDVIVVTPAAYLGRAVVGTAKITEVPFDRGFWMEKNGQRMFAVIAQSPDMEQAVNVEAGQTLRLAGVVYDSALASGIAGQMDPKAMETIAGQPAFLLVDAKNISVIEPGSD